MSSSERFTHPSIEPDSSDSVVRPTQHAPSNDRESKRATDAEHDQADFAGKGRDSWSFSNKDRAPRRSPADRSWKGDKKR